VDGIFVEVKPEPEPKRRQVRTPKNDRSRDVLVTMSALALNTLFNGIGQITAMAGLDAAQWPLTPRESDLLSGALADALSTLDNDLYAKILIYVEKYGAWAVLAYTAGLITIPRIAHTKAASSGRADVAGRENSKNATTYTNGTVVGDAGSGSWENFG
jgi:hypothetical protein